MARYFVKKMMTSWNMQNQMGKSYKVFLFLVAFLIQTRKFEDFFKRPIWRNGGKGGIRYKNYGTTAQITVLYRY